MKLLTNKQLVQEAKAYDLLILVDATCSMTHYLEALNSSLPNIISLSILTDAFSRIGLLAYRDYCDEGLIDWSGWLDFSAPVESHPDIIGKARNLRPVGGGDYPEAVKTGLAKAFELMRPEARTVILLYTDAPPHRADAKTENSKKEQSALKNSKYGKLFMDWASACRTFQFKSEKVAQVFCILETNLNCADGAYYEYLSRVTDGTCFYLNDSRAPTISEVTIDILLAWMGVEKAGLESSPIAAKIANRNITKHMKDEHSLLKTEIFKLNRDKLFGLFKSNEAKLSELTSDVLKSTIPKREIPVNDFSKRYLIDAPYREVVINQLNKVINHDVTAMSINPVFGSLWRAVCNDRRNPNRTDLIQLFGLQVDKIASATDRARMKQWLEESYDFKAEVLEIISTVPEDERFPCVYLDPTLSFEIPKDVADDEEARPITKFTRNELLEIGRSCDYKILRRLGRILTRLSFVNSPGEVPAHIAKSNEEDLIKIPLALARKDLGRKFWKILLHIVVPGTMLSSRPAALLAALSIKLGVQPLLEVAEKEIFLWRDKWNDLEIPETWNNNCLSLLLDADKAYRDRHISQVGDDCDENMAGLLAPDDRRLFNRLVDYKMLEFNMKTTLVAKIGWKPEKSTMSVGPIVQCSSCEFPRSVTMMASNGVCGLCNGNDFPTEAERELRIANRVSKTDTTDTEATWVECSRRNCRAQYVVYNPNALNVRAKCHFCRTQKPSDTAKTEGTNISPAPYVECKRCLNRMIWPQEYRTGYTFENFICVACSHDNKSIVDMETSAAALSEENGMLWLLKIQNNKISEPFNHRSLFHTISTAGTTSFCEDVILFPPIKELKLLLNGKSVHNTENVLSQLISWVDKRRTEAGTCSLCFSQLRKDLLLPACGRSGCTQTVCTSCLQGWYGLNGPGRIVNTAAMACPFCRRAPTAKTLARYGMGIHVVGNLQAAVKDVGEWIYGWCKQCSFAIPYMERSCAAGAPVEVVDWECEDCKSRLEGEANRKECPGCGVLTEKIDGCDHVRCAVPTCQVHWCFFCGEQSNANDIYVHMDFEH